MIHSRETVSAIKEVFHRLPSDLVTNISNEYTHVIKVDDLKEAIKKIEDELNDVRNWRPDAYGYFAASAVSLIGSSITFATLRVDHNWHIVSSFLVATGLGLIIYSAFYMLARYLIVGHFFLPRRIND